MNVSTFELSLSTQKHNSITGRFRLLLLKTILPLFLAVLNGIPNLSKAQTTTSYNWSNVAIGGGGFVSSIITSKEQPDLMYARTDVGGAYRYDRANSKWIPLMDWASDQQQGAFGVESIAIDPKNPATVYMLTGISYFNSGKSYILKSTDYGANFSITEVTTQFKVHGNGMGRQNGEKLQVDPNNSSIIYCGTRWNGLFRSSNGGSSWNRLTGLDVTTTPNENGVSFVVVDKSITASGASQRIFAGVSRAGNNQNLYMSSDGGSTFTALVNANLGANLMPQRAVLSGDGNLFITYGNGAGPHGHWSIATEDLTSGQIWKYSIASNTWTNVTPSGYTRAFGGISVDPANPQRLVASTINTYMQQGAGWGDRFFISTNGGSTWTDIIASRGFTMDSNGVTWVASSTIHWSGCIEFDPANTKRVWVTSGNGIFVNEDINSSKIWKFNVKGLEETVPLNAVSITGGPFISVIGDYDGFRHTDITAYAPIHTPSMGTTTGLAYATKNKNKLVRVGTSMYYSTDIGVSWTKINTINGSKGQVALSANGNVLLHSPDGSSTTYRSTNDGLNWTAVSGLNFSNAVPVADGENSNKFYAYNNSSALMMVSNDGGATFTSGGNPGNGGSRIIRTVPGREGHIWVACYVNGLSRSVNSGTSFSKIAAVSYCGAVGIGKAAPGSAYETIYIYGTVGGVLGIYRSIDEGASWTRVNDDGHQYGGPGNGQFVLGDMNVYGRVYMSTAGRGIVYGEPAAGQQINLNTTPFSINENGAVGTVVGTPTPVDVTQTNLHGWSIISGNTNNVFTIDVTSGKLSVAANPDFETKASYTLTLGFRDKNEIPSEGKVTINVVDVNEAPSDISLSKTVIVHQNTMGAVLADITTTDPDVSSAITYSLVTGTGSDDNASFIIVGNQLKANVVFNYDTKKSYNLRLKATDNGGLSFEKSFNLQVKKSAGLALNNLQVKVANEICASNNDGKISLTAATGYNYKAILTGAGAPKEFNFTQNLEIPALSAGTYNLCVSSEEVADYNRCFDLQITEPSALSVYSFYDEKNRSVQLQLSGSETYYVSLNGKEFTTTASSLNLALSNGLNDLKVNAEKDCQGIFQKSFLIGDDKTLFPNPFDSDLTIGLGNDTSKKAVVNIYSIGGQLAYTKNTQVTGGSIPLQLSHLQTGVYILRLKTEQAESTFRIVKK